MVTLVLEAESIISSTAFPKVFLSKIQQACNIQLPEQSASLIILNSPEALKNNITNSPTAGQTAKRSLNNLSSCCNGFVTVAKSFSLNWEVVTESKQSLVKFQRGDKIWPRGRDAPPSLAEWNAKLVVLFFIFKVHLLIYRCICPWAWVCAPAIGHIKRVRENKWQELVLSFLSVGSKEHTWVLRFVVQCLHPLGQLKTLACCSYLFVLCFKNRAHTTQDYQSNIYTCNYII